jgi:hypothetical protein
MIIERVKLWTGRVRWLTAIVLVYGLMLQSVLLGQHYTEYSRTSIYVFCGNNNTASHSPQDAGHKSRDCPTLCVQYLASVVPETGTGGLVYDARVFPIALPSMDLGIEFSVNDGFYARGPPHLG